MKLIESERLYLREFEFTDVERLSEIYSDTEVMKYIGGGGAADKTQTQRMIEAFRKSYADNGFGIWALIYEEGHRLLGHCGLSWLHDKSDIELAYLLSKEYWGQGFATEISAAVLEYGFKKLGLKKIVALAYPDNFRSINVIRKLGMQQDGEKIFFEKSLLFFSTESPTEFKNSN